ncbi:D-alanine--D-alanine ligase [Celerinatantimonas yamalensis]|uniref:D-alanine--D-alanine ligase n=1 Tax=Celerinatantimonas yamalensis TaxID=559956 RepID=A0ABW9G310_9GAMM
MQQNKIRVAVLFGGRSAEHEVSLQSARNVIAAIDPERFETILIGIDRDGGWYLNDQSRPLLTADNLKLVALNQRAQPTSLLASDQQGLLMSDGQAMGLIDVVFPVLHGPYGEDGSVQGLAKLANVACVGSDILGSAIGMDKDVAKRLLRDSGIAVADYMVLRRHQLNESIGQQVSEKLGYPVYVKPANMGSSVGVSKVTCDAELVAALRHAFDYDIKVLVEAAVVGRELECAVLGNDEPEVCDVVGEIIADEQFYSYDRKYIEAAGAKLQIPADVDAPTLARLRQTALQAYQCLEARGMGRVDMFLTPDGEVLVNEINTLPGFTAISMYPKLWQASGVAPRELVTRLIELALDEYHDKQNLKKTEH